MMRVRRCEFTMHKVMNAPNKRPVHRHETVSAIECGRGLDDGGLAMSSRINSSTFTSGSSTSVVSVSDLLCAILFGKVKVLRVFEGHELPFSPRLEAICI